MLSKFGTALLVLLAFTFMTVSVANAQRKEGAGSDKKALAIYTDAAEFQNNGAYELAIEEWQKLLKEYPRDPLASKAAHYLGVSSIQVEEPDYDQAIKAFAQALQDRKLDVREESMINLSWCLFTKARSESPNSSAQKRGLQAAKDQLESFVKEFGDGNYMDQALFYLGEIEYTQGDAASAINYYKKLLDTQAYAKSSLRPDAMYAIGVAYEEQKQLAQAKRNYESFTQNYPEHRLAQEVGVRLADLMLTEGQAAKAEAVLAKLAADKSVKMADYALLRLGYALEQQGKSEAAAEKYLQLLKEYPKSVHASTAAISVGQSLYKSGQYEKAIEQFSQSLDTKDAQASEAAHWMAITLMRLNKPQEAVKLLEDALTWSKEKQSTLQMDYADALYAIPGQVEKAKSAYELIARENPDDALAPRAAYNAAFAALQTRKFEDARKWSEWFLQKFPQDPLRNDVAYVAAETLLQEGEHESAIKAYSRLREADKANPSYLLWTLRLAMAQYLAGDYQDSIQVLGNAMPSFKEDRQKAEALFIVGASLMYEEKVEDAIANLKASHQTMDNWSSADEVLLMLAEAYQRAKNNDAAKQTLELLLKKYPATRLKPQVEYKLGQLSAAMDQFDDAIDRYRSIVGDPEASSYHSFAQYGIAWALMQQEKYEPALQSLKPLLATGKRDSIAQEAELAQGVCLRKLGRTDDAIVALEKVLENSPKGMTLGNGLYELGLAYTERGKLAKANQLFRRILQEVPNYPAVDRVLYELAWNYEEGGDKQQAMQYFDRLKQDFASSEFGAEATYMVAQRQYDAQDYSNAKATYTSVLKSTTDPELLEKTQYKIGWSLFQQEKYDEAAKEFAVQAERFRGGALFVDALFMRAECAFKSNEFDAALPVYQQARVQLERGASKSSASDQVKTLIYLHGAQCLRERKDWTECEQWLGQIMSRYPDSPYLATAMYEMGFCKQNQNEIKEALKYYSEVANNYRTEIGARSRFMMGEVYFAQRDFAKAIPEFQRVMYGFGGDKAPAEIKNWQVKSAYEAARCSEVLIEKLGGTSRDKVIETAEEFYSFIVEKHATHNLASKAQTRLGELRRLR